MKQTVETSTSVQDTVRDNSKSAFGAESSDIADTIESVKDLTVPRRIFARVKTHFKALQENKFFPRMLAAKGGLKAVVLGVLMFPFIAVSGVSLAAVGLAASAIGLIAIGGYSAIAYGGHLIRDGIRLFRKKVLKHDLKPLAERKAVALKISKYSPWALIARTGVWKWMAKTRLARGISNTRAFKAVQSWSIWRYTRDIGRDQDVILRAFATGGGLTTMVVSGAILATQIVALPAITFSVATLIVGYAAVNLVVGAVAFVDHGRKGLIAAKNAARNSFKRQRRFEQDVCPRVHPKLPDSKVKAKGQAAECPAQDHKPSKDFKKGAVGAKIKPLKKGLKETPKPQEPLTPLPKNAKKL